MFKEIAKKIFTSIFLFILIAKMAISCLPLLVIYIDESSAYAVIMQLEIEHQSSKESESKENPLKKEWLYNHHQFDFSHPLLAILNSRVFNLQNGPVQPFYPSVPTPPPSV
jgi:hypothetical protein